MHFFRRSIVIRTEHSKEGMPRSAEKKRRVGDGAGSGSSSAATQPAAASSPHSALANTDLLSLYLSFLSFSAVRGCARVCRLWRQASESDRVRYHHFDVIAAATHSPPIPLQPAAIFAAIRRAVPHMRSLVLDRAPFDVSVAALLETLCHSSEDGKLPPKLRLLSLVHCNLRESGGSVRTLLAARVPASSAENGWARPLNVQLSADAGWRAALGLQPKHGLTVNGCAAVAETKHACKGVAGPCAICSGVTDVTDRRMWTPDCGHIVCGLHVERWFLCARCVLCAEGCRPCLGWRASPPSLSMSHQCAGCRRNGHSSGLRDVFCPACWRALSPGDCPSCGHAADPAVGTQCAF